MRGRLGAIESAFAEMQARLVEKDVEHGALKGGVESQGAVHDQIQPRAPVVVELRAPRHRGAARALGLEGISVEAARHRAERRLEAKSPPARGFSCRVVIVPNLLLNTMQII